MFSGQSEALSSQGALASPEKRAYGPRPPYCTHIQQPSLLPYQASTSSIARSHSTSPLDVSDIEGSTPAYLKRLSKPTRDVLKVSDIPGATSQHSKFRSRRFYNNPVDPVYYWGDGLCVVCSGGVVAMQTKKKMPGYLLSMFRGHDSHKTDDIEGAKPVNKMLSYAEKAKSRMHEARDRRPWQSPQREKVVFPVTPLASFLMDVHRTLGRPPVHKLKRRRDLTPVATTGSLTPI